MKFWRPDVERTSDGRRVNVYERAGIGEKVYLPDNENAHYYPIGELLSINVDPETINFQQCRVGLMNWKGTSIWSMENKC